MIYDDKKIKEMSRSILPSRNRVSAKKERQRISRAARRNSKVDLRTSDFEEDDGQDEVEFHRDREIHDMVFNRRDGDKINPVIRWAKAIVKDIPKENRTSFMASMLPDGLIGWHALGHIKSQEEFPRNELAYNSGYGRRYRVKTPPMSLEIFLKKIEKNHRMLELLNKNFLPKVLSRDFPILTLNVEKKRVKETIINPDGTKIDIYETYFVDQVINHTVEFPGLQLTSPSKFLEELTESLKNKKNAKLSMISDVEIIAMLEKKNPSLKGNLKSTGRRFQVFLDWDKAYNFNIFVSIYFDNFGDLQKIKKATWPGYYQLNWKFKELN